MNKVSLLLYKCLMGFCGFLTLGSLAGLPSVAGFLCLALFGGLTYWSYKKIDKLKAEIVAEEIEKAPERERAEAEEAARRAKEEAEKFSSLGMTHGDYPQIYQEDLDEYISIQSNLTDNDDYGRLKIIDTVDAGNDRGYFQTDLASCKIHWLDSTQKEKTELMSLLLEVEDFEDMDAVGEIMTFLYPAIHALYTKSFFASRSGADETISKIAQFISDKSVEQIQSLQAEAETLTELVTKIDSKEFKTGTLSHRIFAVELKTHYDVAADEVQMSFSILIVEEDTRQKFSVTREKFLGTV